MGQRSVHRAALGCAGCAVSGMPRAIAKAGGLGTRMWSRRPNCHPFGEDSCDRGGPEVDLPGSQLTDRPGILPHESAVECVQFADWN
jgi:hypothetical protein